MKTLPLCLLMLLCMTLSAQNVHLDTIKDFQNPNPAFGRVIFKSPKGKFYKVDFLPESKWEMAERGGIPTIIPNCADSTFAGKARKSAKTSMVTATTEDFATVSALLKTLQKDAFMRAKLTSNSPRAPEEKRYVRLKKDTYLYAFKKETDNDYHVIIGDNIDPKKATYFNIEISGLPATNFKAFQTPRRALEKKFVQLCNLGYAVFSANPIKISIEGSLFFDVDHLPGQVGPIGFQPTTVWEIHPVSKITFL